MQKSSDFDLRDVLWRDIFTIFGFKFVFSPEVDKNCWCFICPKIIWSLRLAQSYLKIILSKRQCVLLLHEWWIYAKHSKRVEHAETGKPFLLWITLHTTCESLFTFAVSEAFQLKSGGISWTMASDVNFLEFVHR